MLKTLRSLSTYGELEDNLYCINTTEVKFENASSQKSFQIWAQY